MKGLKSLKMIYSGLQKYSKVKIFNVNSFQIKNETYFLIKFN